ncbi:MAG: O-antigen polymerase [Eubacteriales bacterium]
MIYIVIDRKAPLLTLIAVVDVVLYTLLFGGRYLIVKMMMYYIFAFLIVKVVDLEKIKKKKLNLVFIGLIVIAVIVVTSQRNWGNTSIIENTVVYYVGSFTFLDVLLNELNWSYSPLYGMGTFGFIVNLVIAPFAILFKIPYRGSDYLITQITAIPRFISPTQSYNAMTTMIYPFFRDFGFLGIIIGTSFLAWFVSLVEEKFMKNKDMLFLCFYVYLAFVLFNSVLLYDLLFPSAFITMVLVFVFIKNKSFG